MKPNQISKTCPCGSKKSHDNCCGVYIEGSRTPPTAEALMRSRYCAYVLKNTEYLLASWHPNTRPAHLDLDKETSPNWQSLSVFMTEKGQTEDDQGIVAFVATYLEGKKLEYLCEKSRFEKLDNRWYYLDGELLTLSKNGPCPCGSGKKFKRCCGKSL